MAVALVVLFLVVPVVEIYVIVQVGQEIGVLPTVGLLVVESLIGGWLVKREGGRAWRALKGAVGGGRVPSVELADAALVLVGGTLLLTPGFVTDVLGFFLVLPLTRPVARRLLGVLAARRAAAVARHGAGAPRGRRVVRGEVLRDDDPPSGRGGAERP
jgi:UPF0716 protein FxsA